MRRPPASTSPPRGGAPAWARLGLALAVAGGLYLAVERVPAAAAALEPGSRLTARAAAMLIEAAGIEVELAELALFHPNGFGFFVDLRCTALGLALLLAAGLLALGGSRRERLVRAAAGAAGLLALNLVRLASLFALGASRPELFDLAHDAIWRPAMLAPLPLLWIWHARQCGIFHRAPGAPVLYSTIGATPPRTGEEA